jgi:hypothetical protein
MNESHERRDFRKKGIEHKMRLNSSTNFVWNISKKNSGRRGRRRRKLLDFKERRGYSHLKEEALDRTMWTARFGSGFGPVVDRLLNE